MNTLKLYFHPNFPECLYGLIEGELGKAMFVLSDEYIGIDGEMEWTRCTFPLGEEDITANFEFVGEL